jgi:sigma-E factor negative regulatory protein RseA
MNDQIKTQISAFVDGELPANEAELLLRRMCQDVELRRLAAEYVALGRAMRGERAVEGMDRLRDRIAAALDDTSMQQDVAASPAAKPRFLRPLAGVAIAATAALAAILILQQVTGVSGDPATPPEVRQVVDRYVVPGADDEQLRRYRLRHAVSSSYLDPNGIGAQLATLELADGVLVEIEPETAAADAEEPGEPTGARQP